MRFNLSLLRFLSLVFSSHLRHYGPRSSDRGTIAGTVLDSTGASVAHAQVVAKGVDTSSVCGDNGPTGGYRMPEVKIGTYQRHGNGGRFSKTEQKTAVEVQVNTVSTLNFAPDDCTVNET